MSIGVTAEHVALAEAVRRWVADRWPRERVRERVDTAAGTAAATAAGPDDSLAELARLGWLGPHLSGDDGGGDLVAAAIVIEELGYGLVPGPVLPTVLAGAVLAGADHPRQAELSRGASRGAVALVAAQADGVTRPVLSADVADLLVAPVPTHDGERWCLLEAGEFTAEPLPSLDLTRPLSVVRVDPDAATRRHLPQLRRDEVEASAALLFAAEAVGGMRWCVETAAAHARTRRQFGRPIGAFQAVKHRCADMLATLEQARAAVWDAAAAGRSDDAAGREERRFAAAAAAVLALDGYVRCAADCIQILGGIGFTWDHDAHLHLRRAVTLRQLAGGTAVWRARLAALALRGVRVPAGPLVDGPDTVPPHVRDEIRRTLAPLSGLDRRAQRAALADAGLAAPHLPPPWGRAAGMAEQLVIAEELRRAGIRPASIGVGEWAIAALLAHGTARQQERWIPPTLRGQLRWCQLFSEPEAGSDLAAVRTVAARCDGGFRLTGQKVWTSAADRADVGICLARTDPEAPRHQGLTYLVVDMRAPGVVVRPLRQLTGEAEFSEVFLDGVFVPDDAVVGRPGDGWSVARTTLGVERLAMGRRDRGGRLERLLELARRRGVAADPVRCDQLGDLVARAYAVAALDRRVTARVLSGTSPGAEASVRKLLLAYGQQVTELAVTLLGAEGATEDGEAAEWTRELLASRGLTIGGGTSEMQRNAIAERLLDLPRDP